MATKRATAVQRAATPRRNGENGEDQQLRTRLVEAAIRLFSLHGYQPVTVAQIGAAADVTGPALYRHFSSKEALLSAALHVSGERTLDDAKRIVAEASSPAVALERLVRTWAREAIMEKSRMTFGYFHERAHLPAADRRALDERYVAYVGIISKVCADVTPELQEEERRLRIQAALAMVSSSPFFVSNLHEATLMDALVDLCLKILS